MTSGEFRTAIDVAVGVFIRKRLLNVGPLSEEEMWDMFEEFVRDIGLSQIVEEERNSEDEDIPF